MTRNLAPRGQPLLGTRQASESYIYQVPPPETSYWPPPVRYEGPPPQMASATPCACCCAYCCTSGYAETALGMESGFKIPPGIEATASGNNPAEYWQTVAGIVQGVFFGFIALVVARELRS